MERAQKKVESRNFDIRKTLIKFDDVMNDQRQVIFSQRLNILKDRDINSVLKDFFDEILAGLKNSMSKYNLKSNDDKYLTEIKNITGNSLSDKKLLSLGKDEFSFSEEIKSLFKKTK